ncbi:MAG: ATP-binding protein [Alloprevotella sp.]
MIDVRDIIDFRTFIDDLLLHSECDDLEFKSAAGGFPGSFWETYSAFANSEGGLIVLGVAEKKDGLQLDDLSDERIEKYTKDFWNNVNNRSTISCNLMKLQDLQVVDYKGYKLMLFFVPMASREQKPVYRSTQPYNGTFKRNYEGDYKCTEREVQRMFSDANVSYSADSRILDNYSLDDIDLNSLAQYRRLFALSKPDHPWLALDDLDLLKKLGGYRADRKSGKEGFTVAGLLMFGKTDAITDEECCPDFFPDYQERLDDDFRWTHRIVSDGTWEANLFQYYRAVLPRLQAALPKPFILEDNIRREETSAHVAVREALINLCIHADYTENASLLVQLYKGKMLFSNPGTLLVSKMQYYQGGESVCRNRTLQKMFMMLGSAEKAGSGVDKILSGWKEANWRKPVLTTKSRPDKCVLTLELTSIMDEAVEKKLKSLYGPQILQIDHNRLHILHLACVDRAVSNESLRFSLDMHRADIAMLLKDMCKAGLLESSGYGRGTTYHLPEKLGSLEAVRLEAKSKKVGSSETDRLESKGKKVTSSGTERLQAKGKKVTSSGKDSLQTKSLYDSELDSERLQANGKKVTSSKAERLQANGKKVISSEAERLQANEEKVASSEAERLQANDMKVASAPRTNLSFADLSEMICKITHEAWVTPEEISLRTGKQIIYLKKKILPRMLAEGMIEMLYPHIPTHPNQQYRATRKDKTSS